MFREPINDPPGTMAGALNVDRRSAVSALPVVPAAPEEMPIKIILLGATPPGANGGAGGGIGAPGGAGGAGGNANQDNPPGGNSTGGQWWCRGSSFWLRPVGLRPLG